MFQINTVYLFLCWFLRYDLSYDNNNFNIFLLLNNHLLTTWFTEAVLHTFNNCFDIVHCTGTAISRVVILRKKIVPSCIPKVEWFCFDLSTWSYDYHWANCFLTLHLKVLNSEGMLTGDFDETWLTSPRTLVNNTYKSLCYNPDR